MVSTLAISPTTSNFILLKLPGLNQASSAISAALLRLRKLECTLNELESRCNGSAWQHKSAYLLSFFGISYLVFQAH